MRAVASTLRNHTQRVKPHTRTPSAAMARRQCPYAESNVAKSVRFASGRVIADMCLDSHVAGTENDAEIPRLIRMMANSSLDRLLP